jgi:hypothetical protein
MNQGLDAAAYPALIALGQAAGVPPEWFLLALYLESRLETDPPGNGSYAGLSQINNSYLTAYGLTRATYVALPASQQITRVIMPWYLATIRTYLGHTPRSPGVLYALNLAPSVVKTSGDAPGVVLYASPSSSYTKNQGLDVTHDGQITIADLDSFMANLATQPAYQAALQTLRSYEGSSSSSASPLAWGFGIAAVGAGVAVAIHPALLDPLLRRL